MYISALVLAHTVKNAPALKRRCTASDVRSPYIVTSRKL